MQNNKKWSSIIIGNTALFIFVLLFVGAFRSIFGSENTVLGVGTLVLSLLLLSRDLTTKPFKYLMSLIAFFVVIILGAYAFETNLWLGLIANFVIITSIGYFFTYEVKKPLNMIFGLQYMLLLGSPITAAQLPNRFVAGICAALIIMGVQLLANRNKLAKSSQKLLTTMQDKLLLKINLIKNHNNTEAVNKEIDKLISDFKILIFESGQNDFKLSKCADVSTDILSCIEKIDESLDIIENKNLNNDMLNNFAMDFEKFKNGKLSESDIDMLLSKYKNEDDLIVINDILTSFEILNSKSNLFKELVKNKKEALIKDVSISEDFKFITRHKKNIKSMSNRVAYALRVGTLVALTGFATSLMHLQFGKWMIFTVFSLTQPHAEYSFKKTWKRVFGTVVGGLIIFIAFSIIKDSSARMIVLLVAGYFFAYVTDYRNTAILITVCSVTMDAMSSPNPNYVIMSRLFFVALGVVISLFANKFLLRRGYKDEEEKLMNMQKELPKEMLKEVITKKGIDGNNIRTLFLVPTLIENRINMLDLNVNKEHIDNNKALVSTIYHMYLTGNEKYKSLMRAINDIVTNNNDVYVIKSKLNDYVKNIKNTRERAFALTILNTFNEIYKDKVA